MDDGIGIPDRLETAHDNLLNNETQQELFQVQGRLRYKDTDFDKRFEEPAAWLDNKARLIAFGTDILGTSKTDRAKEVKGLQYLREQAVLNMSGSVCIESDGAALGYITRDHRFGQLRHLHFTWCKSGGTGINLAVPMSPVESSSDKKRWLPYASELGAFTYAGSVGTRIRIKDHLILRRSGGIASECNLHDFMDCAKAILEKIVLPESEDDIPRVRRGGLLIIDWSELPESKRVFHFLLVEIAKRLAEVDPRSLRPFVFANLPKGLCGVLGKALSNFSTVDNPIPICSFVAEQREPFWLGLDGDNSLPEELRNQITCEIRRKITDHKENRTEAFYRDCLTHLLDSVRPLSPYDARVLSSAEYKNLSPIRQTIAFARLKTLAKRCALFREEQKRSTDGEIAYSGSFRTVFNLGEIVTEVRKLFLDEFCEVFKKPPVCFIPPNKKEGIRLINSKRIVARYFRSDAIVDSPIAMELTQELTAIALGIARQMPGERIDWVVSCTSPLHWFVHRIIDGLAEYGVKCSHHVFPSYEAIPESMDEIGMHSGETVLAFTDVIASGQTAYRMAESLVNHFGVRMAGLIALADIRTAEERKNGSQIENIYNGTIVCLYNEPEPHCKDRVAAYHVHPETVVPKRDASASPATEFFELNYSGVGPLVEGHAFFRSAKRTLDLLTMLGAVRFGHFQHGSHHSEIFVDVEKVLDYRAYRNILVIALFRYIVANEIQLVLYPSHSSVYMLVDELRQCFVPGESSVEFIMACRTFRGTKGTSYSLTRFSPYPGSQWKRFSNSAVLILDDAVCTGATVESIIAELSRIGGNYYTSLTLPSPLAFASNFSVHVVAFLNRLPRVTGDFWGGLGRIVAGRVQFSSFIRIPLAADAAELCPQCHVISKLVHARESATYCLYAREFLSWWIFRSSVVSSHERRHFSNEANDYVNSKDALRLAGYFSALERHAYDFVYKDLYNDFESMAVRVLVRSRAGFLKGQFPGSTKSEKDVDIICRELEALIDLTVDERGYLRLDEGGSSQRAQDDVLVILQALTQRYLDMRPTQEEVEGIMACLLMKLALTFDKRLVVGGIAAVLDSCHKWFTPPNHTEHEWRAIRDFLKKKLHDLDRAGLPIKAALMIDWLDSYLTELGKGIDSVGKAVRMLAEFAKKGRSNHFYGRYDFDELHATFTTPAHNAYADGGTENIRRTFFCSDLLTELVSATRILQSSSLMDRSELQDLQDNTEKEVQELRTLCISLRRGDPAYSVKGDYARVRTLFLHMYYRWFPQGEQERPKAAIIIGNFTPNLVDALDSAWLSFPLQQQSTKVVQMEIIHRAQHRSMKVLIDPALLTTAMHQLFDNIYKYSESEVLINIACDIRYPGGEAKDTLADPNIDPGEVEVVVSNTGTARPELGQVKLRGLSAVRMRLSEYGAELEYAVPATGWSFQVSIKLLVWTKEGK